VPVSAVHLINSDVIPTFQAHATASLVPTPKILREFVVMSGGLLLVLAQPAAMSASMPGTQVTFSCAQVRRLSHLKPAPLCKDMPPICGRSLAQILQYSLTCNRLSGCPGVTLSNIYFKLVNGAVRDPELIAFLKNLRHTASA
jgi:hypothetical protein